MKIVSFKVKGKNRIQCGALLDQDGGHGGGLDGSIKIFEGGSVLDLIAAVGGQPEKLRDVVAASKASVEFTQVDLCSPLPRPPSMRDGYAFRQHVATARKNRGLEMIPEFDLFPVFYFTNHNAVFGPGEIPVEREHLNRLDYELEVAIVIGKEGKNISKAKADDFIFGYTIMNDWSARHLQMEEMKLNLGPAKGKDFATSLGPYLITRDELIASGRLKSTAKGEVLNASMKAFINDKQYSQGNVNEMNWTFAEIIERASYGVSLMPGDVIGSGTVGTGCLLELNGSKITDNLWLKDGDRVRLDVEAMGSLENRVSLQKN